jgi:hypothetical protein
VLPPGCSACTSRHKLVPWNSAWQQARDSIVVLPAVDGHKETIYCSLSRSVTIASQRRRDTFDGATQPR